MKKQKNTNAAMKQTSDIEPITTFNIWNCIIAKSNGVTSKVINPIAEATPRIFVMISSSCLFSLSGQNPEIHSQAISISLLPSHRYSLDIKHTGQYRKSIPTVCTTHYISTSQGFAVSQERKAPFLYDYNADRSVQAPTATDYLQKVL